ncbi:MAG TPA: pyridoxamine 5'-phosphate oxidase family protein [Polyangiaceae bacterium]|nr:pyridoxamine 5'-phosphate oxidase family protein [Polyangiaceae bacterium]
MTGTASGSRSQSPAPQTAESVTGRVTTSTASDISPYHPGESELQTRVGVREQAERMGRKLIRSYMPDEHQELFEKLNFIVVGSVDERGQRWASILVGVPGFMRSPDPSTLRIDALPSSFDPLSSALRPNAPLGLLGIEFATRRRNRMNGWISECDEGGFAVRVLQSFGNCPKYITPRKSVRVERAPQAPQREGPVLSAQARALIAEADTCFLASASLPVDGTPSQASPPHGVDVSHRGGPPGFIRVRDTWAEGSNGAADVLMMPDYRGNNAFNTLGNLLLEPGAGLTIFHPERGDLLSLTCRAELIWDGPELERHPHAQRVLALHVVDGVWVPGALPLRFDLIGGAP